MHALFHPGPAAEAVQGVPDVLIGHGAAADAQRLSRVDPAGLRRLVHRLRPHWPAVTGSRPPLWHQQLRHLVVVEAGAAQPGLDDGGAGVAARAVLVRVRLI